MNVRLYRIWFKHNEKNLNILYQEVMYSDLCVTSNSR